MVKIATQQRRTASICACTNKYNKHIEWVVVVRWRRDATYDIDAKVFEVDTNGTISDLDKISDAGHSAARLHGQTRLHHLFALPVNIHTRISHR